LHEDASREPALASQLSLEVAQSGSHTLFTFGDNGPMASTITGTYFDDGAVILDLLGLSVAGLKIRRLA